MTPVSSDYLDGALMVMAAVNLWRAVMLGRRIDRRFGYMAPCEASVMSERKTTILDHLVLVILVAVFYLMYLSVGGMWMWLRLSLEMPGPLHWMMFAMLASCHMVMARVLMCARRAFTRLCQIRIGEPAAFVARYCTVAGENLCCVVAWHGRLERGEDGDCGMDG